MQSNSQVAFHPMIQHSQVVPKELVFQRQQALQADDIRVQEAQKVFLGQGIKANHCASFHHIIQAILRREDGRPSVLEHVQVLLATHHLSLNPSTPQ